MRRCRNTSSLEGSVGIAGALTSLISSSCGALLELGAPGRALSAGSRSILDSAFDPDCSCSISSAGFSSSSLPSLVLVSCICKFDALLGLMG